MTNRFDEAKKIKITDLCAMYGFRTMPAGNDGVKLICPHPGHNDTDPSCNINPKKNLFRCPGCDWKGSAIDFVMGVQGVDNKTAVDILLGDQKSMTPLKPHTKERRKVVKYKPEPKWQSGEWAYTDSSGEKIYAATRFDYPNGKKDFRVGEYVDGKLTFSLPPEVERVPLYLHKFKDHTEIWIVEGEKCADALNDIGIFATTFAGGSKAWREDGGKFFRGKRLVLVPDNDKTGRQFMWQIAKDAESCSKTTRMLDLGTIRNKKGYDVANKIEDLLAEEMSDQEIKERLILEKEATCYLCDGEEVLSLDYKQAQAEYDLALTRPGFDLSGFFPEFKGKVRHIIEGDCICITGITGGGKTALANSLAVWLGVFNRPVLNFSVELSLPVSHERFVSIASGTSAEDVEKLSRAGTPVDIGTALDHIYTIPLTGLTMDMVKDQYMKFVKLHDEFPEWIFIDYLQLMKSDGSRYERFSDLAEDLRVLPKELATRVIFLSQESRPDKKAKTNAPTLHSGKESGSIENSVSLFLSVRDHETYPTIKVVHVIKNTRGTAGFTCQMAWDGPCTKFSPPGEELIPDEPDEEDEEMGPDNPVF